MQDHARGLLSGDKVDTKLYDLMFESLEFQRTLESLSSAREEIRNQSHEVCGNHLPFPPRNFCRFVRVLIHPVGRQV